MSIKYLLFPCVLVAGLALAGCGQHDGASPSASAPVSVPVSAAADASGPLAITSWGPQLTKAGVAFNVQPNGGAALWIRVNRPLDGGEAAVDFNGTLLKGSISGSLVTAAVPSDLYAKSGKYEVQVLARKGKDSAKSNGVTFTVE